MDRARCAGLLIGLIIASTTLAGCLGVDLVTDDFDGEYATTEDTVLTVMNPNGNIKITRTDGEKVEFHADITSTHGQEKLDEVDIQVDEQGDGIDIRVEYDVMKDQAKVNMEIKVPWRVYVETVTASNGNVDVELDMSKGDCQASSSNGWVKVKVRKGITYNLTASSSNGDVEVRIDPDENINLTASTTNGKATISGLDVTLTTDTDSAKMGSMGTGGPEVKATTSNGDAEITKR
jgi:hypothetical protein